MIRQIDWIDYAQALLGRADWADAASIAALFDKAQRLLPSDLLVLPVIRHAEAQALRADLRAALAARPAGAQPLRTLLADNALRGTVAATLTRLGESAGAATLALGLPAPEAFATVATSLAGLPAVAADADLADDAAVYLADFVRAFAAAPITALRLSETAFSGLDAPIVRVAAHYGWEVLRDADVAVTIIAADTRPEDARAIVAQTRTAA